jgi:hypothetical protein
LDAKRTDEGRQRPFSREHRNSQRRPRPNAAISKYCRQFTEPIDLELDLENRVLYWTDRGDPPRGNTVNRVAMDVKPGKAAPEILVTNLMEGIGIALNVKANQMFFTDLAGDVYTARLDGSEKKLLLAVQGNLTGIAYAELSTN